MRLYIVPVQAGAFKLGLEQDVQESNRIPGIGGSGSSSTAAMSSRARSTAASTAAANADEFRGQSLQETTAVRTRRATTASADNRPEAPNRRAGVARRSHVRRAS